MDILSVGAMSCDIPIFNFSLDIFEMDAAEILPTMPSAGGDALNVSVTASKLGQDVALVGKVGDDIFGEVVVKLVKESGVNTSWIKVIKNAATPLSFALIEPGGERHFLYTAKLFDEITAKDVPEEAIKSSSIVHFGSAFAMKQMDAGGTRELFEKAHQYGKITSMDATFDSEGKWLSKISNALYETDIFLPSYEEAKSMTGCKDPREIKNAFIPFGIKVLIIKLGKKGCYVTDFSQEYFVNTFESLQAVDTTGAGDSFVGGFLSAYLKKWDLFDCVVFANAVASHNVTKVGATGGIPDFETTIKFINDNKHVCKKFDSIQ